MYAKKQGYTRNTNSSNNSIVSRETYELVNIHKRKKVNDMKMIKDARRFATVEINNELFILDKHSPIPYETNLRGYTSIYDAYKHPSDTKVNIWKSWLLWFHENEGTCVVSSKNCNFFTIEGYVTDKETGKRYFAYITYANKRLYAVE